MKNQPKAVRFNTDAVIILVALAIVGCGLFEEDEYIYEGFLPSPCWKVHKIEVQEFENEFKIIPMIRMLKYRICPVVLVPCTVSVELIAGTTVDTLKVSVISRATIMKTIKVIQG